MPVRRVSAHPRVDAVRGCVALTRGPLVYCLEQADLPPGTVLEDVRLDPAAPIAANDGTSDIPVVLTTTGSVAPATEELYTAGDSGERPGEPLPLTAVPYFLWGNRSEGPMRVWVPVAATR